MQLSAPALTLHPHTCPHPPWGAASSSWGKPLLGGTAPYRVWAMWSLWFQSAMCHKPGMGYNGVQWANLHIPPARIDLVLFPFKLGPVNFCSFQLKSLINTPEWLAFEYAAMEPIDFSQWNVQQWPSQGPTRKNKDKVWGAATFISLSCTLSTLFALNYLLVSPELKIWVLPMWNENNCRGINRDWIFWGIIIILNCSLSIQQVFTMSCNAWLSTLPSLFRF